MASGIIEFNMADDLPPRVVQKLNYNFKALLSSSNIPIATNDTPGIVMGGSSISINDDGSMDLNFDDLDSEEF